MRVALGCSVLLLVVMTGMVVAQDTNFDHGPQYLLTNGSSIFARPIATPIMSPPAPVPEIGASDSTEGLAAGAEDATVTPQPPAPFDFFPIFYGRKWVNEIRMSSLAEDSAEDIEPPTSLVDEGVEGTSGQGLIQWGYGPSLGQAAAQGRAQSGGARHVYTNEDIDRLRKSG